MAKHQPDAVACGRQPGVAVGRVCERHDGRCVLCDSMVRPCTLVRLCDWCGCHGSGGCVVCGRIATVCEAYYCHECTLCEKDREGCPRVVTPASGGRADQFYQLKKYGFQPR